uniref:Uncharacterized protein n=1 Tax=viral metagenome TaxID=1070528 RepID=A0A6M3X9Z1_9ZZZZ
MEKAVLRKSEINQVRGKDIQASPTDILVKAIKNLTYDDSLGIVTERLLKRIQLNDTLDSWEFETSDNMEVYLRRCQANAYLDIKQEQTKQNELKNDLASELPEITVSTNHLKEYRNHLKSKADKRLFYLYFEKGLTLRELVPKFNASYPTIQRRLLAMSKTLAEVEFSQSLRQPQSLWTAMIQGKMYEKKKPKQIPTTNLSPLRRYRRNQDPEELKTFKADSERIRVWHGKRTTAGLSSYIGPYQEEKAEKGLGSMFSLWQGILPVKPPNFKTSIQEFVLCLNIFPTKANNQPETRSKLEKQLPIKNNGHIGYHKAWGTAYLRHYGLRPWEVSPDSYYNGLLPAS